MRRNLFGDGTVSLQKGYSCPWSAEHTSSLHCWGPHEKGPQLPSVHVPFSGSVQVGVYPVKAYQVRVIVIKGYLNHWVSGDFLVR